MDGQVIHAMSDVDGERLGDVLVRYGKLTQEVLDRAKPIVLGKRGASGPSSWRTRSSTGRPSTRASGSTRGRSCSSPPREAAAGVLRGVASGRALTEDAASNLSTVELILEAARRVADPAVVRNMLGDLDRVLRKDEAAFRGLTNIDFTPADGFLASQIDGTTSARDLFKLIPLPAESVERSLFSLLCTGVVEYRAPVARATQTTRMPVGPPPRPRGTVRMPPPPAPVASAAPVADRRRRRPGPWRPGRLTPPTAAGPAATWRRSGSGWTQVAGSRRAE